MARALDLIQEYGYTASMKVTVDIPDELYRSVKSRAALEGRTVRDLTVELYRRWLEPPRVRTEEERLAIAREWLDGWDGFWLRVAEAPKGDERSVRRILADDRR